MKITQDMHLHTLLSACSQDPGQTPAALVDWAAAHGVRTICLTDHFWDEKVPGASDWYAPQNRAHHHRIYGMLPQDTQGVTVLVGCECEYLGGDKLSIAPDAMAAMDFINIPIDHFHMKDFVCPASVRTAEEVAALYLVRFREVLELPLPWEKIALAHLNDILSFQEILPQVLDTLPEAELGTLFTRCARLGAKVEINTSICARDLWYRHIPQHRRFLGLAKECGCQFTFGSDSHHPQELTTLLFGQLAVDAVGLTEADIFDPSGLGRARDDATIS